MKCILNIDSNHICFGIKAISEQEIYMEEIYNNSFLRAKSYNILKNDECKETYLKFGFHSEISRNYIKDEVGVLNENYPLPLFLFFDFLKNMRML